MKKTMYTCPMHPEIQEEKPGSCPKCGMALVPEDQVMTSTKGKDSYVPLAIIIALILLVTIAISLRSLISGVYSFTTTLEVFMIGFFLVFSGFKLLDLKGFVEGYTTYDLLAKKVRAYGYIYPFIELFFGLSMILFPFSRLLLLSEIIIMTFSGIGVLRKLLKHERFQCACLGTFLKVPLTKVTLIEDFGMALLAAVLLLFR